MRGGRSGEVTKLWPSQQLCALSTSKLVAENAGSTPIADHTTINTLSFSTPLKLDCKNEVGKVLVDGCIPDYHYHLMQVLYHHGTISAHTPEDLKIKD